MSSQAKLKEESPSKAGLNKRKKLKNKRRCSLRTYLCQHTNQPHVKALKWLPNRFIWRSLYFFWAKWPHAAKTWFKCKAWQVHPKTFYQSVSWICGYSNELITCIVLHSSDYVDILRAFHKITFLMQWRLLPKAQKNGVSCYVPPARPHDFFDAQTMDAIRHRAICLNLSTHIESVGNGHSVVFHSTVSLLLLNPFHTCAVILTSSGLCQGRLCVWTQKCPWRSDGCHVSASNRSLQSSSGLVCNQPVSGRLQIGLVCVLSLSQRLMHMWTDDVCLLPSKYGQTPGVILRRISPQEIICFIWFSFLCSVSG